MAVEDPEYYAYINEHQREVGEPYCPVCPAPYLEFNDGDFLFSWGRFRVSSWRILPPSTPEEWADNVLDDVHDEMAQREEEQAEE